LNAVVPGRQWSDEWPRLIYFVAVGSWSSAVKTLAALHSVNHVDIGLSTFGKEGQFYERQLHSLVKVLSVQAKASNNQGDKVGEVQGLAEMLHWFRSNMIKDECSLIHGDYKVQVCRFALSFTTVLILF
jgi:aminoglycoside phosphotransferase (APT) family kinase protein